jgi:hypothetical protein
VASPASTFCRVERDVVDIRVQLVQDAPHTGRRVMWRGHLRSSCYQDLVLCSTKITIHLPGQSEAICAGTASAGYP